ncbi:MAG: FAD-dependent oxidoreductase [Cyanobacteria bacterium SIG26]|nr:FAD-dependent oxidoreductase [Cyanobacteria bacterium SIG26]
MQYDVVIIGGGTAGCAAAYMCAKRGLKTLIIEKNIHLGGAITSGLVIPVMHCGENQINTEFYNLLVSELKNFGGQVTYQGNSGWFNPELTKIVLDKLMKEQNVDILFNTTIDNVKINYPCINSIEIKQYMLSTCNDTIHTNNINLSGKGILSVYIGAKYFIDATGNCDFSKLINCEMQNDNTEFQPMSMRFILSGVNKKIFADWILKLDPDRSVTTVEEVDNDFHFSTAYTWDTDRQWALADIFNKAISENILKSTDCNYFQLFTIAGMPDSVAFNCPRIIEKLNPNDNFDVSKAAMLGREAIWRLYKFCKTYLPGFENSYISNIADELGVRVSNRIVGKYIYTIDDLKSGREFDNPILISNYPVDVHSNKKNRSTCDRVNEYQLPIESLMAKDYDNLFVIGRCLSADYMAQGALRVQSSCFSMGEAVAKYIANNV